MLSGSTDSHIITQVNSLDNIRAIIAAGARQRYENHYICHREKGKPEETCLIRAIRDGQKPGSVIVLPAGMSAENLRMMKELTTTPGTAFCVTPTSPFLVSREKVLKQAHATWAALEYGVAGLKAGTVILAGNNDIVFRDEGQFAGPSLEGRNEVLNAVESYLQWKGVFDAAVIQELTARRVLIESALNVRNGFDSSVNVKVVANYWDKNGQILVLSPDETISKTYQDMGDYRPDASHELSPIGVMVEGCSDSRFLAQSYMPKDYQGAIYNDSIAGITPAYGKSWGGIIHPWKLIRHAQGRGTQFRVGIGHEGCGGAEALVKHILLGQSYPLPVQNWINLAHEVAERVLRTMPDESKLFVITADRSKEHRRALDALADRVARCITLESARNVTDKFPHIQSLTLHARRDGSVVEIEPSDPSGRTEKETPIFDSRLFEQVRREGTAVVNATSGVREKTEEGASARPTHPLHINCGGHCAHGKKALGQLQANAA